MTSSPKLDDITHILDLIATPLALEIMERLGHGAAGRDIALTGGNPVAVDAAFEQLRTMGIVSLAQNPPSSAAPTLTPLGRRLLGAFEHAEHIERSL